MLSLAVISGFIVPHTIQSATPEDRYELLLHEYPFTPPAMTARTIRSVALDKHLIIQFTREVDESHIEALAQRGISVLGVVPRNALLVQVPANTDLSGLPDFRWAGPLDPDQKISSLLSRARTAAYAVTEFHLDVDPSVAQQLVADAGGAILERPELPPTTLLVEGNISVFEFLAEADEVAYIYPASEAMISAEQIHYCEGAMTPFGPLAKFVAWSDGWDGPGQGSYSLTYNFTNDPYNQSSAIISAMLEWGLYAEIDFSETLTPNAPDSVQVLWGSDDHSALSGIPGDVFASPFETGHAFLPGGILGGDVHFRSSDLTTRLHELGHALGLGHSENPAAIMYASSNADQLHPDDIAGIQSIYAVPTGPRVAHLNQGNPLTAGNAYEIRWSPGTLTGANVAIYLLKNGVNQGAIISSTPNDGSYSWLVPISFLTSNTYTISIVSTSNPLLSGSSNVSWTIQGVNPVTFASLNVPVVIQDITSSNSIIWAESTVSVPSGLGQLVDVDIGNVGITFGRMQDLVATLLPPNGPGAALMDPFFPTCTTPLTSGVSFGFDTSAPSMIGADCPPVANKFYYPQFVESESPPLAIFNGIDPAGTWRFLLRDDNPDTGASGSLASWSLILKFAAPNIGPFAPVYVDIAAATPGAGTQPRPYTSLVPALDVVADNGTIYLSPATYSDGGLIINQPVTLARRNGTSGTVIIE